MGTCEAIEEVGKGAFMVSPGDLRPPQDVYNTVKKVLGDDYPWYPVVGNHELDKPEYMVWLREWASKDIPYLVRRGPKGGKELVYSFDYQNAHLVVINQYYDDNSDKYTGGDIAESLSRWLEEDLAANEKPFVFVFGHEPLVSLPDCDNGRHRHKGDNLDAHPENSHRFQQLLRKHEVTAYVCGHTHNFSYAKINGLWQIDSGHARGMGDKGAPSTFLKFQVGKENCWAEVYRDDSKGGAYILTRRILLD
ncbi:MAG: metallophosphoesterase [Sedimentisphaerales bacterium]|nr:metallophosphoesterase [Sedimentisphaerales bacterium]